MDNNPYASPRELNRESELWPDLFVDGQCLAVRGNVVLPSRCIITNDAATHQDRRVRSLEWTPSFRLAVRRPVCQVSYCVSRRAQMRYYRICAGVMIVAALIGWFLMGKFVVWFLLAVGIAIGGRSADRLKVCRAENGYFWIDGFGHEVIASWKEEFDVR